MASSAASSVASAASTITPSIAAAQRRCAALSLIPKHEKIVKFDVIIEEAGDLIVEVRVNSNEEDTGNVLPFKAVLDRLHSIFENAHVVPAVSWSGGVNIIKYRVTQIIEEAGSGNDSAPALNPPASAFRAPPYDVASTSSEAVEQPSDSFRRLRPAEASPSRTPFFESRHSSPATHHHRAPSPQLASKTQARPRGRSNLRRSAKRSPARKRARSVSVKSGNPRRARNAAGLSRSSRPVKDDADKVHAVVDMPATIVADSQPLVPKRGLVAKLAAQNATHRILTANDYETILMEVHERHAECKKVGLIYLMQNYKLSLSQASTLHACFANKSGVKAAAANLASKFSSEQVNVNTKPKRKICLRETRQAAHSPEVSNADTVDDAGEDVTANAKPSSPPPNAARRGRPRVEKQAGHDAKPNVEATSKKRRVSARESRNATSIRRSSEEPATSANVEAVRAKRKYTRRSTRSTCVNPPACLAVAFAESTATSNNDSKPSPPNARASLASSYETVNAAAGNCSDSTDYADIVGSQIQTRKKNFKPFILPTSPQVAVSSSSTAGPSTSKHITVSAGGKPKRKYFRRKRAASTSSSSAATNEENGTEENGDLRRQFCYEKVTLDNCVDGARARKPSSKVDASRFSSATVSPRSTSPRRRFAAPSTFSNFTAAVVTAASTPSSASLGGSMNISPPQLAKHQRKAQQNITENDAVSTAASAAPITAHQDVVPVAVGVETVESPTTTPPESSDVVTEELPPIRSVSSAGGRRSNTIVLPELSLLRNVVQHGLNLRGACQPLDSTTRQKAVSRLALACHLEERVVTFVLETLANLHGSTTVDEAMESLETRLRTKSRRLNKEASTTSGSSGGGSSSNSSPNAKAAVMQQKPSTVESSTARVDHSLQMPASPAILVVAVETVSESSRSSSRSNRSSDVRGCSRSRDGRFSAAEASSPPAAMPKSPAVVQVAVDTVDDEQPDNVENNSMQSTSKQRKSSDVNPNVAGSSSAKRTNAADFSVAAAALHVKTQATPVVAESAAGSSSTPSVARLTPASGATTSSVAASSSASTEKRKKTSPLYADQIAKKEPKREPTQSQSFSQRQPRRQPPPVVNDYDDDDEDCDITLIPDYNQCILALQKILAIRKKVPAQRVAFQLGKTEDELKTFVRQAYPACSDYLNFSE